MNLEENVEQAAVAHAFRVELDEHGFGVARVVLANARVSRIRRMPAGVANGRRGHSWHMAKRIFHAPEAARREGRKLMPGLGG